MLCQVGLCCCSAAGGFPPKTLQEALHELSPFEEGSLGTYDYLTSIKTVDRMFLFVSQLLLYFERDLLQYPPPGLSPSFHPPIVERVRDSQILPRFKSPSNWTELGRFATLSG
jgi:hypothetical protein